MTNQSRITFWTLTGIGIVIALMFLSVMHGSTRIPLDQVAESLLVSLTGSDNHDLGPVYRIIVDLRLPRAILATFVGAGIGIVGLLLQTTTRNDLADPFLFGLSSGAAAGAVTVMTVFGDQLGVWTLPIAAFVGGITASILVIFLVKRMAGSGPERLILAGLAVSFIFTALTNYLVFSGDQRAAHSILFWSLGGLGLARWENLPLVLGAFCVIFIYSLHNHRKFDALLAGESTASTLGINPAKLQYITFLVAAFATAIFVSLTGIIGFIGLMVPHIARGLSGALHKGLIILSAILGSLFLLGSDILSRLLLAPQELPVGIVTTSIGGFFVLLLLLFKRN